MDFRTDCVDHTHRFYQLPFRAASYSFLLIYSLKVFDSTASKWSNIILTTANTLITISYFAIPACLFRILSKRYDLPFSFVFLLLGAMIALCGLTHLMLIFKSW